MKKFLNLGIVLVLFVSCLMSLSVNAAEKPRLNKTKISMIVGRQKQLKVFNSTKKIKWESSDKSVVKIIKNGLLKANDCGNAIVTATIGKQRKLKCVVSVKEKPLLPKYATVCVGSVNRLSVSGTNKKVTWKSSKTEVATVNKEGVVTGVSEGKANIVAKVGKKNLKCKVHVKLAISPVQSEISLGNLAKISVEHGASEIYCESSDPTVARVFVGQTLSCKCWERHTTTDVIVCGLKDGTVDITIKNNVNDDVVTFKAVVTKPKDNDAKQKLADYILANGEFDPKIYDGGSLTFTDLLNSGIEKHKVDANEFNKIAFDKIGNYLKKVAGVSWKDLGFEKLS